MAHRRPRRRFTREYKAQSVQRLIESGRPLADIAPELDVRPGQLSQWRNEQLAAGSAEALATRKAEQAETQRLRREVKRLEEEVEILRKATAFFARGIAGPSLPLWQPSAPTMPLRRCAGSSAQASPAFTPGCARSHPDRTARRRKPSCAGTSAASLRPSAGSMARPGSTLNCAGKGTGTRDAGSNG